MPGLPLRHNCARRRVRCRRAHRNIPIPRACPHLSRASLPGCEPPPRIGPYRGSKMQPSQHLGIVWSRMARSLQHLVRGFAIPCSLIGPREQKLGSRRRVYCVRALEKIDSLFRIGRSAAVRPRAEGPQRSWDWRLKPLSALAAPPRCAPFVRKFAPDRKALPPKRASERDLGDRPRQTANTVRSAGQRKPA